MPIESLTQALEQLALTMRRCLEPGAALTWEQNITDGITALRSAREAGSAPGLTLAATNAETLLASGCGVLEGLKGS